MLVPVAGTSVTVGSDGLGLISYRDESAGDLKVALYDTREGSPTRGELQEVFLGEHYEAQLLKVPAGVAHGCRAIGGTAHLIYLTSKVYDPEHEELRIAHDDAGIGYDWTAPPAIV